MTKTLFADIILPLAVRGRFTYTVPAEFSSYVKPGVRVTVPFGNKNLYSGIVLRTHYNPPSFENVKSIVSILDEIPVINEYQLRLWQWISEYYLCTEGEVMKAALPSEESLANYKPRFESYITLAGKFSEEELNGFLDKLKRAPKQFNALTSFLSLTNYIPESEPGVVSKPVLLKDSGSSSAIIDTLIEKGILLSNPQPVARIINNDDPDSPVKQLSESQGEAFKSIVKQFIEKDIVLLHGVTSSGKTEIYIHLIEAQLKAGKQVLYMLPEIALTAQIINRLKKHFGQITGVYHSRFSDPEKVEIWKRVADPDPETGYRLILGVRSSIFLPFSNLGLIIIDEEHDGSYKQHDPAPRYHARDSAIMLAAIHGAKTILGSASPSIETYTNALNGKYGLAEIKERYGFIKMPEIIIANTREAYRKKLMVSHFTPELLYAIDDALGKEEQVILFQNRRGFSPYIECPECGWIPVCFQCAVNMTYHKGIGEACLPLLRTFNRDAIEM